MATREAFAEKQLDEIKKDKDSVYYKKIGGFGGPKPPRPEVGEEPDPNDEKAVKAYNKQLKKQAITKQTINTKTNIKNIQF